MQLIRRIRVALCGLTGHDDMYRNEPGRMYLICQTCGRETEGWTIDPPRMTAQVRWARDYVPRQVRHLRRTAA